MYTVSWDILNVKTFLLVDDLILPFFFPLLLWIGFYVEFNVGCCMVATKKNENTRLELLNVIN